MRSLPASHAGRFHDTSAANLMSGGHAYFDEATSLMFVILTHCAAPMRRPVNFSMLLTSHNAAAAAGGRASALLRLQGDAARAFFLLRAYLYQKPARCIHDVSAYKRCAIWLAP